MFDLPQQHVGGGVFLSFLQGYSSTRTAINEQAMQRYWEQVGPENRAKQIAAINKQIIDLEERKGDPLDRIKQEADSTQRYYLSAQSSARVEAQRDRATVTRLTKAQEKEVGAFDEKVDKIIAPNNIKILATIFGKTTGKVSLFKNIETAEQLQGTVSTLIQDHPEQNENIKKSVKKYIAAFEDKPLQEREGKVQGIPDLPGISQAQMADIYIAYYGLGAQNQDKAQVEQLKDYGSRAIKTKYSLELRSAKGGPRTDARFSTAQRLAGETWADYGAGIEARDKILQAEIDKLTLQRDELALKQAQMASGELDPYQWLYETKGVRNPALGTARVLPGRKPKLREAEPTPFPAMASSEDVPVPVGEAEALPLEAEAEQVLLEIPDEPGPDDIQVLNQMLAGDRRSDFQQIKDNIRREQERKIWGEFDPDLPDTFRVESRPPIPGGYASGTRTRPYRPRPSDEEVLRIIQEQRKQQEERRSWGELDPDVPDRVYHDPAPHIQIDDLKYDEHGRPYSTAVPMSKMGGESTAVPMPTPTFRPIVEDDEDRDIVDLMPETKVQPKTAPKPKGRKGVLEVSQPWRGGGAVPFTLSQNDQKFGEVNVVPEGDAGEVFYLYSKSAFKVNGKDAKLSKGSDALRRKVWREQNPGVPMANMPPIVNPAGETKGDLLKRQAYYSFRFHNPGRDTASLNFKFEDPTQEFYIEGL